MSGEILRIVKSSNYSTISNVPIDDENLSWEALGLLVYLLSKPDNWTVRVSDLINRRPAGEFKISRILRELKSAGYLHREKIKNSLGRFDWQSTVYEIPNQESTIPRKPRYGKSTIPRFPTDGKPRYIVSTELTITEKIAGDKSPETQSENSVIVYDGDPFDNSAGSPIDLREEGEGKTTLPKGKQKAPRQPLSPALFAYRAEAHLNVPATWRADVEEAVGESPEALERWRGIVRAWVGNGWNKGNVRGMLDVFVKGQSANDLVTAKKDFRPKSSRQTYTYSTDDLAEFEKMNPGKAGVAQ